MRVERLWTPWRKAFVEASASSDSATADCFLCAKVAQHDDRANLIVHRGERVFVLLNLYPYNSGHLMVAPYEHTGDFAHLQADIAQELTRQTQACVAILEDVYHPDAFNVGLNLGRTAGAGLPDHLHVHVVPRWNGDTNFMSTVAEARVLPEALPDTYAKVREAWPDPTTSK